MFILISARIISYYFDTYHDANCINYANSCSSFLFLVRWQDHIDDGGNGRLFDVRVFTKEEEETDVSTLSKTEQVCKMVFLRLI